ncbi:MAG: hypothetical protein QXQ28_05825 [Candidatus Nezhaarchaeales archaeon]
MLREPYGIRFMLKRKQETNKLFTKKYSKREEKRVNDTLRKVTTEIVRELTSGGITLSSKS